MENKTKNIYIVVPYSKGLSESFRNVCSKVEVQVHFRGHITIMALLMAPKDKNSITNKGWVVYRFKCDYLGCTLEYISKTGRIFKDRYREHLRATHLFMTKLTPQIIPSNWTVSPLWIGSPKTSPGHKEGHVHPS